MVYMVYYDSDDYFSNDDVDALVEQAFGDITDIDYGSAAGQRPAPANRGRSALNLQVGWWNRIMRQMEEWGVSRATMRNEQLQVVVDAHGRETVRNNQPDIQVADAPLGCGSMSILEQQEAGSWENISTIRIQGEPERKLDNL